MKIMQLMCVLLPQETMDMVNPAMQLASKIPDKKLQVWAATLLAGEPVALFEIQIT